MGGTKLAIEYDNQSRDKQGENGLASSRMLEKIFTSYKLRVFGIAAAIMLYLVLVIILKS
jgi:hypothetical protein